MRKTGVMVWSGWKCFATAVRPTWVMFSLMALVPAGCGSASTPPVSSESVSNMTTPSTMGTGTQTAVIGGGCFWCTEAVFLQLKGVVKVESGYSGGGIANPTYREVTSGLTGHAEVIKITFDAGILSYDNLLRVFFGTHDPTTLNRQGADVGTQYRSVIFWMNEDQQRTAIAIKAEVQRLIGEDVVTEISPFKVFYKAEDYHQDYYARNPNQAYCQIVISPKLRKLQKEYAHLLK